MSNRNGLNLLREKLSPLGQKRLFEFLEMVDTESAARFRHWLSTAPDTEIGATAEMINRAPQGGEVVRWWHARDPVPAAAPAPAPASFHARTARENSYAQARVNAANRDIAVGGAWLGGGLLVTIGSYLLAASSPGGGHYMIATGAMLYGVVRILRGFKSG
jgi:hypothetical protein